MLNIEFIKWEETPELNFLGIAHLLYDNCFVLKFKIVENKDGSGFFAVPPSYKKTETQEKWDQWFYMDSRTKGDQLQDFVRNNVINEMKRTKANNNQTVQQTDGIIQSVPVVHFESKTSTTEDKQAVNNHQSNWTPEECPF